MSVVPSVFCIWVIVFVSLVVAIALRVSKVKFAVSMVWLLMAVTVTIVKDVNERCVFMFN